MKAAITGLAMAAACFATSAAAAQPAGIPADLRPHVPQNLRSYFVAFLVTPQSPQPMSRALFLEHQAYIRSQFEAGVYHLAGPLTDGSPIRGMIVLSASSAEDARRIASGDPAVGAGVFGIEIHPAMFPDLSPVRAEYLPRS